MLVLNAFSLNMLESFPAQVDIKKVTLSEAKNLAKEGGLQSGVGHPSTAPVFSAQLEMNVPTARITVSLKKGEKALIGQYRGPRLEEGVISLPRGAKITWYVVTVN